MSFVVVIKGPDEPGREIRLVEGETYVGRDPANTLVLDGRGVSRRHAKFVLAGERLTLVDLGSTYGTRVNDVTTLRRELAHGDEITIGMHHMSIRREEQEEPEIERVHRNAGRPIIKFGLLKGGQARAEVDGVSRTYHSSRHSEFASATAEHLRHFLDEMEKPVRSLAAAEHAREILRVVFAGYESGRTGETEWLVRPESPAVASRP